MRPALSLVLLIAAPAVLALNVAWTDLVPQASVSRLSAAETARSVLAVSAAGTICHTCESGILARTVPCVADARGCPLFVLDCDGEVAKRLIAADTTTFFASAAPTDAHSGTGVSLIGSVENVQIGDIDKDQLKMLSARTGYSVDHLRTQAWLRVIPGRVHVRNAIYGSEDWVQPEEYAEAQPNMIGDDAAKLLSKLNAKHASDLVRFASVYSSQDEADIEACTLLSVDHLGFDIGVQKKGASSDDGVDLVRVAYKVPPQTLEEATSAFTKLFQEAYAKQQGWM